VNAPENEGDDSFAKFRFLPDYGDGYIGQKRPAIFIVR
jgi:acylaminoacyl-peptidase